MCMWRTSVHVHTHVHVKLRCEDLPSARGPGRLTVHAAWPRTSLHASGRGCAAHGEEEDSGRTEVAKRASLQAVSNALCAQRSSHQRQHHQAPGSRQPLLRSSAATRLSATLDPGAASSSTRRDSLKHRPQQLRAVQEGWNPRRYACGCVKLSSMVRSASSVMRRQVQRLRVVRRAARQP
jgi:hypothetical protein